MINNKFKVVFLSIITFGLIWLKWRKKIDHEKNKIYQIDSLPFKINDLVENLGKDNFIIKKLRPSSVEFEIKEISIVKLEEIKKMKGVSGIFVKSSMISIIFGVYSRAVYNLLKK
ncbi:PTS sugar transporter subunit IIABC [Mycoplasmopsis canis]|uniref:PTS sugar transporter subunit IIABC n=1 Tax=Mycoplasmopsis canis TaxID=29555 RepID=UPI0006244160|nr:PTS sugar transporter subunit IIABC [Mycoplasmopsis canis]AKF40913.1 PTS sugar transporter subunit IIABC [Mycoplasmopsis canis]